jgi:hypothetical protein
LKAMATVLRGVLTSRMEDLGPGESVAERVVCRLVDNALAGDLAAIRFIFEVLDGEYLMSLRPAGRPAVDRIDPDD